MATSPSPIQFSGADGIPVQGGLFTDSGSPQQGIQFSDEKGQLLNLRSGTFQSPPPGQGPDIQNVVPSGNQIGTTIANALPGIGATAGTTLAPEAAPISGPLGAGAGAAVANILRSYAPQYFSENGKTPGMGEQLSNIGQNAAMEGTGQVISRAVPNLSSEGASLLAKLPGFKTAVNAAKTAQNLQAVKDAVNATTDEGMALKRVMAEGSTKSGAINDTEAIRKALEDPNYTHVVRANTQAGTKVLKDLISPETRKNVSDLMDQLDKVKEKPNDSSVFQQGGKFILRTGLKAAPGMVANSVLGNPLPASVAGGISAGGIELTQSMLSKIVQNPSLTKALIANADSSTPPALAKLYQQGLLRGLRGEQTFMQSPSGEREKVTINDEGVPQLSRGNPNDAPSEPSSKYSNQPPPPGPGIGELIEQSAGIRQPQAQGRFTRTPIYIDKDNLGLNDETTGQYFNRPNPKIVVRPTGSSSFGEDSRVIGHEQIHALLDKNGNPKPPAPDTPLLNKVLQSFRTGDRAGMEDREIPAYMGAYEPGQLDNVSEKDSQDWMNEYMKFLPKPAQDTLQKIMKSVGAARQWE